MNKILSKEVSFELAKLLKEKKYDKLCKSYYYNNGTDVLEPTTLTHNNNLANSCCVAPTIAEVIDWVLEKYGIWISVSCDCGNDNLFYSKIFSTEIGIDRCIETIKNKDTPLEAYEEAIKYVLLN